jgi:hypothetical protein
MSDDPKKPLDIIFIFDEADENIGVVGMSSFSCCRVTICLLIFELSNYPLTSRCTMVLVYDPSPALHIMQRVNVVILLGPSSSKGPQKHD